MRRFSTHFGLLGFLLAASFPLAAAELSFVEGARRHLAEVTTQQRSAVAVLVARDGKIILEEGFGLADVEAQQPATAETKFRIGSISKQFTAAAILRLAEQGQLSLSDPLARHFPEWNHRPGVTLRHLLTHTSGLHSYTEKPEFFTRVTRPIEPADLIAWFKDDKPDFAPGEGFHYCNSAYFLLGQIVAQVSGMPLGNYLRETFLAPLGMNHTGIYVNASPPANAARGYSFAADKLEPALDWDMSWAGGAGALYSTVGDLFRWNEALFGGKVLNQQSFQAATTPVSLPPNTDGMKYGYGLLLYDIGRLPAVGHGGGLNGWASDLIRVPEQQVTVVVLTNALPPPPGLAAQAISRALTAKFLAVEIAAQAPPAEEQNVDPKTFADYVGRYDYQAAVMTISVEGDTLQAQLSGQPKFQIFPKAKDEFFWKVVDAQIAFVRDEQGKVTAARHTQGGNTFTAKKLSPEAVKHTPEQLNAFVGEYQYGPGAVLTVTRDDTQLYAQMTGQPKFPIFAVSPTEFEWRVVKAKIQFVKGDDGKVTKALHEQNDNKITAPKTK